MQNNISYSMKQETVTYGNQISDVNGSHRND